MRELPAPLAYALSVLVHGGLMALVWTLPVTTKKHEQVNVEIQETLKAPPPPPPKIAEAPKPRPKPVKKLAMVAPKDAPPPPKDLKEPPPPPPNEPPPKDAPPPAQAPIRIGM